MAYNNTMGKRIVNITVVGCARAIPKILKLTKSLSNSGIERLWTIKEDDFSRALRRCARSYGIRTYTRRISNYSNYSDSLDMAVASLMWAPSRHYVVYWDGSRKGLPASCIEICLRMKKNLKVFEV